MQEDFGCDLNQFLFAEISHGLIGQIRHLIEDAVLRHRPHYFKRGGGNEQRAKTGLLLIQLDYTIRTTNSRFNMVYPFYINEGRKDRA